MGGFGGAEVSGGERSSTWRARIRRRGLLFDSVHHVERGASERVCLAALVVLVVVDVLVRAERVATHCQRVERIGAILQCEMRSPLDAGRVGRVLMRALLALAAGSVRFARRGTRGIEQLARPSVRRGRAAAAAAGDGRQVLAGGGLRVRERPACRGGAELRCRGECTAAALRWLLRLDEHLEQRLFVRQRAQRAAAAAPRALATERDAR